MTQQNACSASMDGAQPGTDAVISSRVMSVPRTEESASLRSESYRRLGQLELRIADGPNAGETFVLDFEQRRSVTGGRNEVHDVTLRDDQVSQTHFEIRREQSGAVVLRDLNSTNGIVVRGFRIREAELELGARFLVGSTLLELSSAGKVDVAVSTSDHFGDLYGGCLAMRELFQNLEGIARSEIARRILLRGETGTGKELVARAIHENSARRDGPFHVFDCTGVPHSLLHDALHGHKAFAYTSASKPRLGCFRASDGGTLLIDEVGELPLESQPILLRILESGEVIPLGSEKAIKVNVRVIAATHRDLQAMVAENTFREDLYYRLRGIQIDLPALRERADDIPLLARRFLRTLSSEYSLAAFRVTPDADAKLRAASWPGNVRQLRNAIENAALYANMRGRTEILVEDLDTGEPAKSWERADIRSLFRVPWKRAKDDFKARYFRELLARHPRLKDAAVEAGITDEALRQNRIRLGL